MLDSVGRSDPAEPPAWALRLLSDARVAHLGMLDAGGGPRVLPVTFALAAGRIWSAVDRKPKRVEGEELARVRFLRRDPRAAFTVDSYSEDWAKLAWMQALGPVEIVEADEGAAGLEALTRKYEQYAASPPPGPLLALRPERWITWRALQGLSD
jgi:PPOX class probable F420-dependent enzyme